MCLVRTVPNFSARTRERAYPTADCAAQMSASETGDVSNFLARMFSKAWTQQPTASRVDLDLRPAPIDMGASSGERSWWRRKPNRKLTAFDLLYGLQAQEAAIGSTPSEVEVEVMGMAFQQTAARLEAMGEVEKAQVHARQSTHTAYTAMHGSACRQQCMHTACAAGCAARAAAGVPAEDGAAGQPGRRPARGPACRAACCSHGD